MDHNDDENTISNIIAFIILLLETIIGSFVNGLMSVGNLMDLVAHGSLNSSDSIMMCLGLSRFFFQWLVLSIYAYIFFYTSPALSDDIIKNFQYCWLFFSSISLWCVTWLCVYYCVRIANIQRYIFILLKKHFDRLLPWFLITSVAISIACSTPSVYSAVGTFNFTMMARVNESRSFFMDRQDFAVFSILSVLGSVLQFFIFCIATWLVVYSLLKHTRKVKVQERTGFREPSLKAHYGAVKTMGIFFIFYLFYIFAFNVYMSDSYSQVQEFVCVTIIGAYPSIHSVLLVTGNNKLRQIIQNSLQKVGCYSLRVALTETETV